jgi:archaellum component FlaF (FlaF/FlaG flagellin family)
MAAAAVALTAAGCSSSGSPAAAPSPAAASSSAAPSSAAPSAAAGGTTAVTATETEFHIALSTKSFSPGTYKFTAVDNGHLQHNLVINGPGVNQVKTAGLLSPGQSASVTVTLHKGSYDIYCGVPGHKAEGMNVNITVS